MPAKGKPRALQANPDVELSILMALLAAACGVHLAQARERWWPGRR